jgi:hypothetical protein
MQVAGRIVHRDRCRMFARRSHELRVLRALTGSLFPLCLYVGDYGPMASGRWFVQFDDSYYGGMVLGLRSRASWILCFVGIIAAGILSRVVHTGFVVFDKYLGDALYAAMVYTVLRLFWRAPARLAVSAMAVMTLIELFQLTMIPARLLANQHVMVRICARLIGTEFSFLDLLTYAVGIVCIYLADLSNA